MVILIAGSSHTGKTYLAQRLLETLQWPYLSLDHLKMGLIRSGHTPLTPESPDEALTALLWPIAREMVKTAIENGQNLVIEGCYIPFRYGDDFTPEYRSQITYVCLVFRQAYLDRHFDQIVAHENCIEQRRTPEVDLSELKLENARHLQACQELGERFFLLDGPYDAAIQRLCLDLAQEVTERGKHSP